MNKTKKIEDTEIDLTKISIDSCSPTTTIPANKKIDQQFSSTVDFYVKHNLSLNCLKDSFELQARNVSSYEITQKLSSYMIFDYEHYAKCNGCAEFVLINNGKCDRCSQLIKLIDTKYFVYIPIKSQIIHMFKKYCSEILSYLQNVTQPSNGTIKDIYDGLIYKDVSEKLPADAIILSLVLNTDGIQMFDSNKCSVWPLQIVLNFLPPNLRYLMENILVAGLYFGSNKFDFLTYLQPLVKEFDELRNGFYIEHEGNQYFVILVITHCVADLPAKAKIQGFLQHNGICACGYCYNDGVSIQNVDNTKSTRRYTYSEVPFPLRTHSETAKIMINLSENEIAFGIKNLSGLLGLRNFNIILGFGVDYLHCVLTGVVNKLLELWLDTANYQKDYYIKPVKQFVLNKRLLAIKPITEITRKPRSILTDRKNYKANEFRSILFYYFPPCLTGLQKKKYIDHFNLLSTSVFIMSKNEITPNEIHLCEQNLNLFVKKYEEYYGCVNVTMNIHLLTHMVAAVRNLGPLWSQSAFCFETNNGVLVRGVKGTTSVLPQITRHYILRQTISKKRDRCEKDTSTVLLGTKKRIKLNNKEKNAMGVINQKANFIYINERVQVRGVVYTCERYKMVKTIDYFIKCDNTKFGKAIFYFEKEKDTCVLVEEFHQIDAANDHIWEIESSKNFVVCDISKVTKKWLYMAIPSALGNTKHYVTYVPNFYEQS